MSPLPILFAQQFQPDQLPSAWILIAGFIIFVLVILLFVMVMNYGKLWFQAYMSNGG